MKLPHVITPPILADNLLKNEQPSPPLPLFPVRRAKPNLQIKSKELTMATNTTETQIMEMKDIGQ